MSMMNLAATLPTSVLGFVTTVHAAMVALRKERTATSALPLVLLVSFALTATPWLFQTPVGIAAGLGLHLVWFVSCEKLLPARHPQKALAQAPAGSRPAAAARRGAVVVGSVAALTAGPGTTAAAAPRSRDFVPVSILAVHDETPSIKTFRMVRPPGFDFEAGQFLTVRVQVDGKPHVRCYSISSAPEASGYLEISVKRQGLVSGMLFSVVRPGSTLMVKPPNGKFVYPGSDDRPIVLVAAGVGITPLMSMLRHGVAADPSRPITLIYSVRTEQEVAYRDELSVLLGRHAQVRLVMTVTGVTESKWRIGRIDLPLLKETVPDLGGAVYLMCGPVEMTSGVRESLVRSGVAPAQIRSEVFQAVAAIGAKLPPAALGEAPKAGADEDEDAEAKPVAAAGGGGAPRLVLVKSNRKAPVSAEQSLLDAAEAAGVSIPFICRAGVCGTCKTRLVNGDVQCTSDALDEGDRDAGFVLPCVTWAIGDCALDA
jgi:ferredoxin-NADP reductase